MEKATGLKGNSHPTQAERVLACLKKGGVLTQMEAWNRLGVMRLASRINELRDDGHYICRDFVEVENRYGEKCRVAAYFLGREGGAV